MHDNVLGPVSLPETTVDEIARRADGVPLFIDEMTRTVLEKRRRDAKDAPGRSHIEVPATLQDSLMARLDRGAKVHH